MKPHRLLLAAAAGITLLATAGCFSKRVTRIEPSAVTDLSGRWNDTDSRLVANELVGYSSCPDQATPAPNVYSLVPKFDTAIPTIITPRSMRPIASP